MEIILIEGHAGLDTWLVLTDRGKVVGQYLSRQEAEDHLARTV